MTHLPPPRPAECGSVDVDESGLITGANAALLAWTGLELADVIGRPLHAVLEVRLPLAGESETPADAMLRNRAGALRPVAIGALDGGRRLVIFDLSPDSSFARPFGAGRRSGRRGQERLEILLAASVAFAETRTEDAVFELLADVAKRSFSASHVSVHLRRDGRMMMTAGVNPLIDHWPQGYQPTGARTLLGGEVIVIRTPDDVTAIVPDAPMADVFRAAGIHGAISSPIRYKDEALGSMIVYFDHPRDFDDEAVPLAEALSNQAAQALTRIDLEEKQRRDAMLDAVTGLPGRRLFEDEINRMIQERPAAICVLFIDLDGFKSINDALGHAAGDTLLRQVGARLQSFVRAPDVVGRFGGDEFIATAAVDDNDGAVALAERIRAALAEPYDGIPTHLPISASVGAVLVQSDENPFIVVDQLIRAADHSMYDAKAAGGNRVEVTRYRSA